LGDARLLKTISRKAAKTQRNLIVDICENAGAYPSAEEALDAAVTAVEIAAAPGFEGPQEELEELLLEGLRSGEAMGADEAYWNRLRAETDAMAKEHLASPAGGGVKWSRRKRFGPRMDTNGHG
jgi:hypothetical protein